MIYTNSACSLWRTPFGEEFSRMVQEVRSHLTIVSPYIRLAGVEGLCNALLENSRLSSLDMKVLTRQDPEALPIGTLERQALLDLLHFGEKHPLSLRLRWIPNLHTKLYIFDRESALITSANLTEQGIFGDEGKGDLEYGVVLWERKLVKRVSQDVERYWQWAAEISLKDL